MFGHGVFAVRPGPTLAAVDTLAGHGPRARRAWLDAAPRADPIPAACAMVTALQTLVTRRFDVFDPVVITVGSFHAGTKENVIPDEAAFHATVRSFSRQSRGKLREATLRLVQNIAAAHGLATEAEYVEGYPVTVNDPAEAQFATATAASLFGPGRSLTPSTAADRRRGLLLRTRPGTGSVRPARCLSVRHQPGAPRPPTTRPPRSSTTRCSPTGPPFTPS